MKVMSSALANVRFTLESGNVQCTGACALWANSGHGKDMRKYVRSLNLGVLVKRQCDLKFHSVRVVCGCRQLPPVCFDNRFTD